MTKLEVSAGRIRCTIAWTAEDFSKALLRNTYAFLKTRLVEDEAARLITSRFPRKECITFVRDVCRWGNRPGTAGLVIKNNSEADIQKQLKSAWKHLSCNRPGEALDAVLALDGLDVSFGSKHLRLLSPDKAVVLDSIIRDGLGYERSREGYGHFLADCLAVRDFLNGPDGSPNPIDLKGPWRVCDVEMAIYSKLRGL
tara:strand:+ start:1651 stop:2244 length:594 start_codon:yes stop_codon:yes gene_type:complete